jgi:acetyl esterase/lipase
MTLPTFKCLACGIFAFAAFNSLAAEPTDTTTPAESSSGWQAPQNLTQIPIWPGKAPDMPKTPGPAESMSQVSKVPGRHYVSVSDVSVPTMTIFKPKENSAGAAIIVFPGGGFRILAMDIEGTEICDWVTSKGITCVLLKYRVPNSNHHWDDIKQRHVTPPVPLALQDAQRAIRLVRANAAELGIDPAKIGVMGFSAGGYLVAQTSNIFKPAYKPLDAVDSVSSRPDFAIALYPGHLCRPGAKFDTSIHVSGKTPPTFLVQAWDDPVDNICNSTIYAHALAKAGVPAEVHSFAKGGHAFGIRQNENAISSWPALLEKWLVVLGVLKAPG